MLEWLGGTGPSIARLPVGPLLLLGDSLTEAGPWAEAFPDLEVVNAGVSGDTTSDIAERLVALLLEEVGLVLFPAHVGGERMVDRPVSELRIYPERPHRQDRGALSWWCVGAPDRRQRPGKAGEPARLEAFFDEWMRNVEGEDGYLDKVGLARLRALMI